MGDMRWTFVSLEGAAYGEDTAISFKLQLKPAILERLRNTGSM